MSLWIRLCNHTYIQHPSPPSCPHLLQHTSRVVLMFVEISLYHTYPRLIPPPPPSGMAVMAEYSAMLPPKRSHTATGLLSGIEVVQHCLSVLVSASPAVSHLLAPCMLKGALCGLPWLCRAAVIPKRLLHQVVVARNARNAARAHARCLHAVACTPAACTPLLARRCLPRCCLPRRCLLRCCLLRCCQHVIPPL